MSQHEDRQPSDDEIATRAMLDHFRGSLAYFMRSFEELEVGLETCHTNLQIPLTAEALSEYRLRLLDGFGDVLAVTQQCRQRAAAAVKIMDEIEKRRGMQ